MTENPRRIVLDAVYRLIAVARDLPPTVDTDGHLRLADKGVAQLERDLSAATTKSAPDPTPENETEPQVASEKQDTTGASQAPMGAEEIIREAFAQILDPAAFDHHRAEERRPLAAVQWAARRQLAREGAERLRVAGYTPTGHSPAHQEAVAALAIARGQLARIRDIHERVHAQASGRVHPSTYRSQDTLAVITGHPAHDVDRRAATFPATMDGRQCTLGDVIATLDADRDAQRGALAAAAEHGETPAGPDAVTLVEIDGQTMTTAQFYAARFPLLNTHPGPTAAALDEFATGGAPLPADHWERHTPQPGEFAAGEPMRPAGTDAATQRAIWANPL